MPPSGLAALMGTLQRTRSPWKRLKVLARAVQEVRSLSAEERYRLALQLGIEGGAELIEVLAGEDDVVRERLLGLLHQAEKTDPRQVRAVLRELRDPQRRAATTRRGFEAAGERVLAAIAGPPSGTPAPPVTPPPAAPPPPSPAGPRVDAAVVAAPPPPRPAPHPETPPRLEGRVPPPVPEAATLMTRMERHSAPPPARAEPPPPRRRPAGPVSSSASELASRLAAASLPARFRLLRQAAPSLVALDVEDMRRLLEAFPDGWPRRRVLDGFLRENLPPDLDEAFALIGHLGRGRDRRFCLRRLLHARSLDAEGRERVVEALRAMGG